MLKLSCLLKFQEWLKFVHATMLGLCSSICRNQCRVFSHEIQFLIILPFVVLIPVKSKSQKEFFKILHNPLSFHQDFALKSFSTLFFGFLQLILYIKIVFTFDFFGI